MNLWTLPNILTLSRIAVLPIIVTLIWPGIESRESSFWAGIAYTFAGATDFVDGYFARRLGQVSVIGKFLDPLSDKLFYLVTLLALLQLPTPRVPFWVVVCVLVRELAITGLRAIASAEGVVIAADRGGKLKTIFATGGMVFLLIHYRTIVGIGSFVTIVDFHLVGLGLTYISLFYSIRSAVDYLRGFQQALTERACG